MLELYETINIGDTLEIEYKEERSKNLIYSATKDGKSLRSVEGYNNFIESQKLPGILSFIFVELIFGISLTFVIILNKKEVSLLFKIKNRKQG